MRHFLFEFKVRCLVVPVLAWPVRRRGHACHMHLHPVSIRVSVGRCACKATVHGILAKQLKSLGSWMWGKWRQEDQPAFDRRDGDGHAFRLWMNLADRGPDQRGHKNLCALEVEGLDDDVNLDLDCQMHQYQLATKDSLKLIDDYLEQWELSFRYFSAVAKLIYVWRDFGRAILAAWSFIHGPRSACDYAQRLPRCVVSGRWGSLSTAEQYFLTRTSDLIVPVLLHVFDKCMGMRPNADHAPQQAHPIGAGDPGTIVGDPRVEDQAYFRARAGKYRCDTFNTLNSTIFWRVMLLSSTMRAPWDRYYHFLMKTLEPHEIAAKV